MFSESLWQNAANAELTVGCGSSTADPARSPLGTLLESNGKIKRKKTEAPPAKQKFKHEDYNKSNDCFSGPP